MARLLPIAPQRSARTKLPVRTASSKLPPPRHHLLAPTPGRAGAGLHAQQTPNTMRCSSSSGIPTPHASILSARRKAGGIPSSSSSASEAQTSQPPAAAVPAPDPGGSSSSSASEPQTSQSPAAAVPAPGPGGSSSSVLGCALLVAGTTIGAGMLALPTVTAAAGFGAASITMFACWVYTLMTGLLVAEVTINTLNQKQRQAQWELQRQPPPSSTLPSTPGLAAFSSAAPEPHPLESSSERSDGRAAAAPGSAPGAAVSLSSMTREQLGQQGAAAVVAPYLFLHYSLLVAYIAKSGELLHSWLGLPLVPSALLFTALLGSTCCLLPAKHMDTVNGVLVGLMVASFMALLAVAASGLDPRLLTAAHWPAVVPTLPVMALAFVFANIVPVVVQRLNCDTEKIKASIFWGMGGALAMFMLWEAAVLGSAPAPGTAAAATAADPLLALRLSNPLTGPLIEAFTFTAIATSFIGFLLSLTDFIGDALKSFRGQSGQQQAAAGGSGAASPSPLAPPVQPSLPLPPPPPPGSSSRQQQQQPTQRSVLFLLALVPSLALALINPDIFLSALDYAGTYGVMSLFGLLPAVLAWKQRYPSAAQGREAADPSNTGGAIQLQAMSLSQVQLPAGGQQLVPGGKPLLLALGSIAVVVLVNQASGHAAQLIALCTSSL